MNASAPLLIFFQRNMAAFAFWRQRKKQAAGWLWRFPQAEPQKP
jgi:hypothetical protein